MPRIATLALLAALGACSTLSVRSDYAPARTGELVAYRTYAWVDQPTPNEARAENPVMRDQVRAAVERSLAARGLRPAPAGSAPDVRLAWSAAVHDRLELDPGYTFYGTDSYPFSAWWGPGFAVGGPTGSAREFEEGALVVDMIDGRSNELVWRGVARAELGREDSAANRAERVDLAVRRMFEHYPPES